jgi:ferric-dicitrate binding protein FerR (iron transport regulator)
MEDQESRQASADGTLRPAPAEPTPDTEIPASHPEPRRSRRGCRRWVLIVLVILPLLCCAGYWLLSRFAVDAAAQVDGLRGLVHVQRRNTLSWNPAEINQLLWGKDWIRTGQGSSARLRFFDVSTADVHEETEVLVEKVAEGRIGNSGTVILKNWVGRTSVRAIRLMDARSAFQVDTPTASTVVRGARFTVDVERDGETQVDVYTGSARVQVGDESLSLRSGERLTVQPDGTYRREQFYRPDTEPLIDRLETAWDAPGEVYQVELPEDEINQFLAALSTQSGSPVYDLQVWLIQDEARVFASLNEPAGAEIGAAFRLDVKDGALKPQVDVSAAGFPLPVPGPVADRAAQMLLDEILGYLAEADDSVEFDDVQIRDGSIVATGTKRAGGGG